MCYGCTLSTKDNVVCAEYLSLLGDLKGIQYRIKMLQKDILKFEGTLPDDTRRRFHKARSKLKVICAEVGEIEDVWSTPIPKPNSGIITP